MKSRIILIVLLAALFTGCDSPTDSFDRVNKNDPLSPAFNGGTVTGLQVSADTSGAIIIQWSESKSIVTKNVIEKSLGDTLNFTSIAELHPDNHQFVDTTLEVRKNTYYRLSSYIEQEREEDVLFGRTQAQLMFGEIENDRIYFLEESNSLRISWNVDAPLYTHFIITSENVLNEQQENSVKIPANVGTVYNELEDPLLDIDFNNRNYKITGIIEKDGIEEVVVEKDLSLNVVSYFGPRNIELNILNEQDWHLSWEGKAFFAPEVELIRKNLTFGSCIYPEKVYSLPTGTQSHVDSLIIKPTCRNEVNPNHFRMYSLRFKTESGTSMEIETRGQIRFDSPTLSNLMLQHDPNSLTLSWSAYGGDTDLIKGFIIETPKNGVFQEYARVDANEPLRFTDTEVSGSENYTYTYRVRTLTSTPSPPATYGYVNNGIYTPKYNINTGMNYVTSMEVSSDKRYLVASSFREGADNSIEIHDLENYPHGTKNEIRIPGEQISDFKISQNDATIYFAVSSEGAIYKADFPSGNNIEKIIDDAFVGSTNVFNIDVSADNSFIVGTGGRGFVKKWSLATYEADFVFAEYSTPTFYLYKNIAISPDGNFILGNNGVPFILDAENGSVIKNLNLGSRNVADHQFSPNGDYFAFTSDFKGAYIFSSSDWTIKEGRPGPRLDFHPYRQEIMFAGPDGIYTKDLDTQKINSKFKMGTGSPITARYENAFVYIDDNEFATVSGFGNIIVWEEEDDDRPQWFRIN